MEVFVLSQSQHSDDFTGKVMEKQMGLGGRRETDPLFKHK